MPDTQTTEDPTEWWMFLHANPIGVDMGTPEELSLEFLNALPENVRKLLWSDKTTARIFLLSRESNFTDDQMGELARIVRAVVTGEISSANMGMHIKERLELSPAVHQKLVTQITQHFIAPNYFQISQLYERKQKAGSAGSQRPAVPGTTLPRNVVDLRNPRPSPRTPLPPSPPPVPNSEDEPPDNFPTPV